MFHQRVGLVIFKHARRRQMQILCDYGVLLEDEGIALCGLFIIDPKGILRCMLAPSRFKLTISNCALTDQYGEVCPANWTEGTHRDQSWEDIWMPAGGKSCAPNFQYSSTTRLPTDETGFEPRNSGKPDAVHFGMCNRRESNITGKNIVNVASI
ncbi:hypothetical protein B0H10DRAFT_1954213 [Mycena sp. CBHHK59/15]|nr:hypothetical protein B0H10DRAFT_1954213 [Mycena sp. CBHHK59/15]